MYTQSVWIKQTVWIMPLVESEIDDVRKLIDEHSDAVFSSTDDRLVRIRLVYRVEGTARDVERVKKQFRRLTRGKIKFKVQVIWE